MSIPWTLLTIALLFALGAYAQRKGWIDMKGDERPLGSAVVGMFETVFAPSYQEAAAEIEEQSRAVVPMPTAGDPLSREAMDRALANPSVGLTIFTHS